MLAAFLPALALDSNLLPDGSLSYSIISILHPRPARSPWHAPCVSAERYDTPWDVRRQRRIHCLRARDFFFFFSRHRRRRDLRKVWILRVGSPLLSETTDRLLWLISHQNWKTGDWHPVKMKIRFQVILNKKILSKQTHLNTPFGPFTCFFSLCIKKRHQMKHFFKNSWDIFHMSK